MAYIIAEPCIGTKDTACVDACPVDCIHPKKDTQYEDGRPGFEQVDQLFIDPVECIDCGACVPVCPVSAIFALDDLPEKWHSYIEKNGSVAKFLRSDSGGCRVVNCRIRLGGEPEQPGDEESLADRISFCQPSHSALANHVHRFNSL